MTTDFSKTYYPLGIQCGRKVWDGVELTRQFRQKPLPRATFFRHLLADYLRQSSSLALSAAELELLATLNQVLRRIAVEYLHRRNCRIDNNRIEISGQSIDLPELERVFYQFIKYFPAVPTELELTDPAQMVAALNDNKQVEELLLEIIILYTQTQNPALKLTPELFVIEEQQL
ncbi:MAG: hypothetical protein U9R69_11700, partial [Thermodesulfobacteriota bacterium]|nr:hypothetical protein [Thermodesulfobacteriota bacterium]